MLSCVTQGTVRHRSVTFDPCQTVTFGPIMEAMTTSHPLQEAIRLIGVTALARELQVTHQAVRKWEAAGRLPRTEWTGETGYAERIEVLTGGAVT